MYELAFYNSFKVRGLEAYRFEFQFFDYRGENCIMQFMDKFYDRFHIGLKAWKINKELLKQIKLINPDLVFLYRAVSVKYKTVKKIKRQGCTVFSYNNDDPFSGVPSKAYWRHYLKSAYFCNHNFIYRNRNKNELERLGIENVSVLMPYYVKEDNYPNGSPKVYDVVFIGHFENDGRDRYIKALIDSGIDVTVFGDEYWKRAPLFKEIKTAIQDSKRGYEYNKTLNQSKIALVFLSRINHDTYTRRCFEIPATKTLMLCEFTVDMAEMFEPDKEAVYFTSCEDLLEKCSYLLTNPDKIVEIGENGYKRLLKDGHSVEDRAKEVLGMYNQVKLKQINE